MHRIDSTEILETREKHQSFSLVIEVLNARATPNRRVLSSGTLLLGAGLGADIVIDEPKVSRRHLQLGFFDSTVEAIDLGSRNGTFCNGQRFTRLTLEQDATLQLGSVHVRVVRKARAAVGPSPQLQPGFDGIVGHCEKMTLLFAQMGKLGSSTVPLLICGETGTGKDAIARAIHERSPVGQGPYVVVNCGGVDSVAARTTLLGQGDHAGAFEQADGGTIVLDRVGELPLDLQGALLQVLDAGTVTRVGDHQSRTAQARILATSNSPLATQVSQGTFRSDLYYRLSAITLQLPALRDRSDDLRHLAFHFAAEFDLRQLPEELLGKLSQYDWPGNVRELRNVIMGYAVLGALPASRETRENQGFDDLLRSILTLDRPYHEQKEDLVNKFISSYLTELMRRTNGNQSEAAKIAGLDRAHLNKMLAKMKRGTSTAGADSEPPRELDSGG